MNVEEITFGIEIETVIPHDSLDQIGGYGRPVQVRWLPDGWKVGRDVSIKVPRGGQIDNRRNWKAAEFVSPVLKGREGLQQAIDVIKTIKEKGAHVNNTCGLHIHVGFNKNNRKELTKLTSLVANFEKAIYAQTGTKSREQGRWCESLQRQGNVQYAMQQQRNQRYNVLNTRSSFPTVEFRAFAATLNVDKIVGHLLCCIGLVEKSLESKRTTKFTAKKPVATSPIARKGEGQTAVTRLFYGLGWTKGRERKVYGDLFQGIDVSLKSVKKKRILPGFFIPSGGRRAGRRKSSGISGREFPSI